MLNANPIARACRASHPVVPAEEMRQDGFNMMRFVVQYDSMAPTVNRDDLVIVDTSITWWVKDGVYLLNFSKQGSAIPATQLLRRVIKIPGQDRYMVSCDNQTYTGRDEIDGDVLDIAGLAVKVYSANLI